MDLWYLTIAGMLASAAVGFIGGWLACAYWADEPRYTPLPPVHEPQSNVTNIRRGPYDWARDD